MNRITFFLLLWILAFTSCTSETVSTPKPRGYFRIDFPEKKYQTFNGSCPFTFEYPVYANISVDQERNAQPCWNNLNFPQFNAKLHLTYYDFFSEKAYNDMTEGARTLAMKHTVKANAIDQKYINYPDKKVYGVYYAIEGNTASSVQFFLTDSVKRYFRGALYFDERPQYDSLQPVIKFIKKDIDQMIATFKWKN